MRKEAGPANPVWLYPPKPLGTHHVETLGTVVFSPPNKPKSAAYLLVQALSANIRFTLDGTTPTAAIGFQLVASDPPLLIPLTEDTFPKFFREAAGAILQWQWME